ncbi:MAG: bifunctional diaminohydroxyphosphoribosylaminopyrimidine deaminase/5-amino-6-(5-phosphoribosylamino)uracil reductase RibD [Alphaproteobacteria bacterium]|nr:bifunctional diaminohydroxyphosphoribosylaminopyrimidine deaminase/5-amino-6-(5-phosphoribosylamino)uracil reductase RibD [Alphaproteobacteria bacterium]
MMALALRQARLGLGRTAPNPSVGAVIADEVNAELIAMGTTADGGRPHAEPQAIDMAGGRARGKTMYVTLEPCSHTGHTPPCAEAIIAAGLSRVVIAQEDPDPRVSGRGINMLRDAGIAVSRGLMREHARWITRGHIVRVTERRPFIQIKMAVSPDGTIPRGADGKPLFVTGQVARAHGHMMRASADAIMVGAGTMRDDDPDLTCRLPGLAASSPVRTVLAGNELPDATSRMARTASTVPVWIMATKALLSRQQEQADALRKSGCRLFEIGDVGGRPWLPSVCETLVGEGMTRLLLEGGPTLWRTFAAEGLADEVVVFQAGEATAAKICETDQPPAYLSDLLPELSLRIVDRRAVGNDVMLTLHHDRQPPGQIVNNP